MRSDTGAPGSTMGRGERRAYGEKILLAPHKDRVREDILLYAAENGKDVPLYK